MSTGLTRRAAILGGTAALAYGAGSGLAPDLPRSVGALPIGAAPLGPEASGLILNDASELEPTPVARHAQTPGRDQALIDALRAELSAAGAEGRPVSLAAARHSMGAQSLARDGHVITLTEGWVEPDPDAGLYRVGAGTRWSEVIAALDPLGFSPAVMQSNHDFGVAASFSVGAHGWPVPFGPVGATVREILMLLPSGDLITASRSENPDLFALAMGGYGLVGIIVGLTLEMVPNQRLEPRYEVIGSDDFAARFADIVAQPDIAMAYGRLNVARADLGTEALLVSYRAGADQSDLPPAMGSTWVSHAAARLYRAQVGREGAKDLRWWIETRLGPRLAGPVTRNGLMNEPVATLADRDPGRVDILHEYFIPFEAFDGFVAACRAVIGDAFVEFLNVTLRYVAGDPTSVLAHSPGPRIAAVMSFTQEKTARAEADHTRMTQALIDRVLDLGGSYYLPYRPHARPDQFLRAYPRAGDFAAAKRALDPGLRLRNGLWERYLAQI